MAKLGRLLAGLADSSADCPAGYSLGAGTGFLALAPLIPAPWASLSAGGDAELDS